MDARQQTEEEKLQASRILADISGYVGTTLAFVDNDCRESVWQAAKTLAGVELNKLDEFVSELNEKEAEELADLIEFLRNPRKVLRNNSVNEEEARVYIRQMLVQHADSLMVTPPPPFSDRSIEGIAKSRNEEQRAIVLASRTNRVNNVDSVAVMQQAHNAWLATPEGRQWLLERAQIPAMPHSQRINIYDLRVRRADQVQQFFLHTMPSSQPRAFLSWIISASIMTMNALAREQMPSVVNNPLSIVNIAIENHLVEMFSDSVSGVIVRRVSRYLGFQDIHPEPAQQDQPVEEAPENTSFLTSITHVATTLSERTSALWESTVGVNISNNFSSLWQRASHAFSSALGAREESEETFDLVIERDYEQNRGPGH